MPPAKGLQLNPNYELKKAELTYFDGLGEDFEKFMDDYDVSQRCSLIFGDLLKPHALEGKKILEIGCGTGRISQEIICFTTELTVVDIGRKLVEKVTSKLGCTGVVGDACSLPFEDNSFDCVISSECIEHTLDPKKAIHEICRVCRPGGVVCLTSPNALWYPVVYAAAKTRLRKFRGIENWLFPCRAAAEIKKCGVTQLRLSGCHLWPFQLKFSRPVLRWLDKHAAGCLYPVMINYGICGVKKEMPCIICP